MKLQKTDGILVLSHFLYNPFENTSAAPTQVRNFLIDKVDEVVQIEIPFPNSKERYAYCAHYKDSRLQKIYKFLGLNFLGSAAFFMHPFIVYYFLLRSKFSYDLVLACDNLVFLPMLALQKIGLSNKIIYYSVDYIEERFKNRLLNNIYHFIDRLACKKSVRNWVVAKEQIKGRSDNGLDLSQCAPFEVVPIGYRNSEIKVLPMTKIDYYNLVFCGAIRESAGPQLVVRALPILAKKFPKIQFSLAGDGNYQKELIKLAKELGVLKRVRFYNNVKKHSQMVKILTRGSLGLAPYAPVKTSLSYKSDPAKIKLYLACGLPVITTKIATSGPIVEKKGAGKVIKYEERNLANTVIKVLKNKKAYRKYRDSALKLSEKYDINEILRSAFENA